MSWNLDLKDILPLVSSGRDNKKRHDLFMSLLGKYRGDLSKKCLQVGVMHTSKQKYGKNFTSIDLYDDRPVIDVHESLDKTSFPGGCFDFIICNAILEHVTDPFGCAREMNRILKPGGEVWVEVPFIQPYHPTKRSWVESDGLVVESSGLTGDDNHGGDYWRFTPHGICQLMKPILMKEVMLIDQGGVAFWGTKK